MRKAFSLVELVFVLAILAIIASIALPYFHNSQKDAKIMKLKAELQMIRSALALARNNKLLKGIDAYPNILDEAKPLKEGELLFFCSKEQILKCKAKNCCTDSLLYSPIKASFKAWMKRSSFEYDFYIDKKTKLSFLYDKGVLECKGPYCDTYIK